MRSYEGDEHVNVGTGQEVSIRQLAERIGAVVAPEVELEFDAGKPDGMPRKLLDVSRLHELGWRHRIDLEDGIRSTYEWFAANYAAAIEPRHRVAVAPEAVSARD